jgi:shikimate kinase/3-dehydroquinate synthase
VTGNIYLCGPSGSGKSTVAPLVAERRGLASLDLDALIEADAGRTIAEIVDKDGEPAFRARERDQLARVAARRGAVVALGGGALEDGGQPPRGRGERRPRLSRRVARDVHRQHGREAGRRPLLRGAGSLERLHAARRPRYREAAIRIEVDGLAPPAIAAAVDGALRTERTIRVNTPSAYDVCIGAAAIETLPERVEPLVGGRVVIVADRVVESLGTRLARAYHDVGFHATLLGVDADEALKSLAGVGTLYERFLEARLDRRGLVIGVGGGTIGDAAGFAAATYQRGVPFAAVPTTLLSAVDAAIGGKTAINLPAGKNLVGTVTQPAYVAIAPQVLRSLPARDVVSGYGEMLKYGLALDAALYDALRGGEASLFDDPATAIDAIARCIALKAAIVARDENDRSGVRAVLNFGHTVAHALEKVAGYGTLRHGEAVIVGMRAELALSVARGHLDDAVRRPVDHHLATLPVPNVWRSLDPEAVVDATRADKKRHAEGTQFVLLDAIGHAYVDDGVSMGDVRAALASVGLG